MLGAAAQHHRLHAGQGIKLLHDAGGILQVFNGFEKRHHDEVVLRLLLQQVAHQASLFLQQQGFQQIAHSFGVADDVVANAGGPKTGDDVFGSFKNGEFTERQFAVGGTWYPQGPGFVEQAQQQCAFGRFRQQGVVRRDAGDGEQLGHHCFVFVRALAQINRGQMKPKHIHRANQRVQALLRQCSAVLGAQRSFDGAQIGAEFLRLHIRALRR